jgi:hypothetical protein
MKKIFKISMLTCFMLLSFYILIYITSAGGFGPKVQYYFWKGLYYIQNPKGEATAEIVIDLKNVSQFIQNNSTADAWMHPFIWRTMNELQSEEGHLGLQSYLPGNPFAYLNLKVILNDVHFTIPNFLVMHIHFKDYYNINSRIKHPELHGIDSIRISCLEGQPIIKNGEVFSSRLDYDFAIEQHQKLALIFNNLGFTRDIKADEANKIDRNTNKKSRSPFRNTLYLEYKEWVKDDFEFTLMLTEDENEFRNIIYITPKETL